MQVVFEIPEAVLNELLAPVAIPSMARVRQTISTPPPIHDVAGAVRAALSSVHVDSVFTPGQRIAIGVGSRGIGSLPDIVSCLVAELRALRCEPFIVPSMGSHGGATAAGQEAVLAHLGITEAAVHAPVISDMSTVVVGATPEGIPVHMSARAMEADAIVFVARIKPHTAFRGAYESGLAKMIAIGLGNQAGAAATHARGFGEMARIVPEMARVALHHAPIRLALAVLENAFDRPHRIVAVPADRILEDEPSLLTEARTSMPRLPFNRFDVLVVDRIGKNISGDGADPNITGRYPTPFASGGPDVSKQVILDLTEESAGNANGIGTADFTTIRAAAKVRLGAMYPNALTSTVVGPVSVPMILPSDRAAIAAALLTCNAVGRDPRVVRIADTLHVEDFWISPALLDEALGTGAAVIEPARPIPFDRHGNIVGPHHSADESSLQG